MVSSKQASTFYMTPEEDARIRNTVKTRRQRCRNLAGQPRESKNAQALHSTVTMASLMADMSASSIEDSALTANQHRGDAMPAFAVGEAYPPCLLDLDDLKPMTLSELQMETHHRGRVLRLRREEPVVTFKARSWTVVKDQSTDQAERLELVLHKSELGDELLEAGKSFAIKEPYFTLNDQGEATLRVDHPSDLIVENESSGADSSLTNGHVAEAAVKRAIALKTKGNAALKSQELAEAHVRYTEGIQCLQDSGVTNEDIILDLYRNRAHVNLSLQRYDEAKADAVAAVSQTGTDKYTTLDNKAHFRAGAAAYGQGEYNEAGAFFETALELLEGVDKEATAFLRRADQRLREQETGAYDFSRIKTLLSAARPRVDAADHYSDTVIKDTPTAGRGLFATKDFEPGELILCEKAFCVVWGHELAAWTSIAYDVRDDKIRGFPAGLSKAIVQKLRNNPSQIPKFMNLYGDYAGLGKELIIRDGQPVIDVFQVLDIVARNGFGLSPAAYKDESVTNASTGLWIHAAYTNHSCLANSEKNFIGDMLLLRAIQPIRAGDEITHSYDFTPDYETRAASLKTTWGFKCVCALCVAEAEDGVEIRRKRQELLEDAVKFVQGNEAKGAKRLTIVKARRLVQAINATYDEKKYEGLPRTALLGIETWLVVAGKGLNGVT
nr:hypothetical protein B0A51_17962 [Rachicladosporium sp. CCFEE 5018]